MGQTFTIDVNDSNDDKTTKLQIRQTLITALNFLQGLAIAYFLCQSLVVGYAIVDAGVGGTAVPHMIWVLGTFFPFAVVFACTRFEVGLYVDTLSYGLYYCYGALVVGIITNGVAVGFFGWEIAQGISNFYIQSFGFLVATTIVTALLIVVELFLIGAIWIFQRDLIMAMNNGWVPMYKNKDPLYEVDNSKKNDTAVRESIQRKYGQNIKKWGVKL
jgi:hypothetical protein